MKSLRFISFITALLMTAAMAFASVGAGVSEPQENEPDVAHILFSHIGDSYGWHIADWGGRHIAIPLPCIVKGTDGWKVFMSSKIAHGHEYEGFFIAEEGEYEGKIVMRQPDGSLERPFDISITKNVFSLMLSGLLLIVLVLSCARWYRRHDGTDDVPSGIAAAFEPLIMMVNDSLVKENIGTDYKRYSPYLLTVFFFIFLNNLLGIVPFFPGGANVTGNIAVTFVLAACTFIAVNVFGNKHYWKEILWPDVPLFLKFPLPIMQIIELFGLFAKPFSLMVRLFANILAGHAMILGLVSVIFVTVQLGLVINGAMTFFTVLFGVFMNCLELLVAFIQAYVFTMLSAVFIGLSRQEADAHGEE
ncbi:MAG: F0F1 ATP synthase subunit A [Bacteroidales bacterium]|nr:F0F1 ATP synthase subunit A [Bacteroidales bacterium]